MGRTIGSNAAWGSIALLAALLCMSLAAQDDPFGAPLPGGGADPAEPTATLPEPEDPVVEAFRSSNPASPRKKMQAAKAMIDYGRPDESRRYLASILADMPDDQAMANLEQEFGAGLFLELIRREDLQPEGAQLGEAVIDAAGRVTREPARLEALVEQLGDPSLGVRLDAVRELKRAGISAAGPLIAALADPGRSGLHANARDALVAIRLSTIEPLLGAMESPDDDFKAHVAWALGKYGDRRALPALTGAFASPRGKTELRQAAGKAILEIVDHLPTGEEAEVYLYRQAKDHYAGRLPAAPDYLGAIELWHWDEQQRNVVPGNYLAEDAALIVAARIATDLYRLDPKNPDYRRLYLGTVLESGKRAMGVDMPLLVGPGTPHDVAAAEGSAAIEDLLEHSMQNERPIAAAAAAEVLGSIGGESLLRSETGAQTPLAAALRHGDRRVRFAAAEAIARIDPRGPFPGSSHLVDVFGYAAGTNITPRVLVVDPVAREAQSLAGMMVSLGYESEAASTGDDALKLAAGSPDVELILLHVGIDHPPAGELIQQLRRDPRTASLPIGLLVGDENAQRWRDHADRDPLALAMPRPYSAAGAAFQLNRLLATAGRDRVGPAERLRQADAALRYLARWQEDRLRYGFLDVMRREEDVIQAFFTPQLTRQAARVLAALGTADCQRVLADYASQPFESIERRRVAAEAFGQAVQRRGIMLTKDEVLLQYDRYNKSASLDEETQIVLGSLLDTIESRARQVSGP